MSTEVNFAAALANPMVRAVIKKPITEIKWNSVIAKKIVEFFTQDKIAGSGKVPDAVLRTHFSAQDLMEPEIDMIIEKCRDHEALGNNIDGFIDVFSAYYERKIVGEILHDTAKSPEDQAQEIIRRVHEISKIKNNTVRIENLGELDIDKVISEELGSDAGMASSFKIINEIMPGGGYIRGSVVQICGSPGTGKSLFLMNEAVRLARDGLKGLYVALGDLMRIDLISRFSSLITQAPLKETAVNKHAYWTNEVKSILNNIRIVVVPAGTIDPDSLADLVEARVQSEDNIDFIMVDYDSNFQKTSESMYEEGDVVYNKMSTLARPKDSKYRVVFIASQPKQIFWKLEIIPMEAAAESARKQAIIDLMITLGKSVGAHVKCGILNIPKNRRGPADRYIPYRVTDWGQIVEIDQGEYTMLKGYSSEDAREREKRSGHKTHYNEWVKN